MSDQLSADDYYSKAIELLEEKFPNNYITEEMVEKQRNDLLKVASFFRLALDQSRGRHSKAAGRLSRLMILLGDDQKARNYANLAIQHNPNEFNARMTFLALACNDLEGYKPHIDSTSLVGTLISSGWAGSQVSGKKKSVLGMANNVGVAFNNLFYLDNPPEVEDLLYYADQLFPIGDLLDAIGMDGKGIYRRILSVPWDKIPSEGYEEKIDELKLRAKGLMSL
jgi:tetratricopeptide (TPR) repeat protein